MSGGDVDKLERVMCAHMALGVCGSRVGESAEVLHAGAKATNKVRLGRQLVVYVLHEKGWSDELIGKLLGIKSTHVMKCHRAAQANCADKSLDALVAEVDEKLKNKTL